MMVKRAFTLIELLVVIAIIAILAAILFPVFAQAKVAAKKTQGISNQKNLSTAFMLYMSDSDDNLPNMAYHNSFTFGAATAEYTVPTNFLNEFWNQSISWPVSVIPYHKNDTKNNNKASILVSPGDSKFANFSKMSFHVMLRSVNWPNMDKWSMTSYAPNAEVFPLSWCGNMYLSMSSARNATTGRWETTANTAPRSTTSLAAPANTMLLTEYGLGIAGTYQPTSYSNYYCFMGYGGYGRWMDGRRYNDGRIVTFADGHTKFYRDPITPNATDSSSVVSSKVQDAFANQGVYDFPDRDSK